MLEIDYPTHFGRLIESTECEIELPVEWSDFFDQRGESPAYHDEERQHKRLMIRTHGLMWFERTLPFCDRPSDPAVIYTKDFSRQGMGFVAPLQIYPEEKVRLVLPTFWVQLHVVRARRITSMCYEIGATLTARHDATTDAFNLAAVNQPAASLA